MAPRIPVTPEHDLTHELELEAEWASVRFQMPDGRIIITDGGKAFPRPVALAKLKEYSAEHPVVQFYLYDESL